MWFLTIDIYNKGDYNEIEERGVHMIFNTLDQLEINCQLEENCLMEKTSLNAILKFIHTCGKDLENGSYPIADAALFANVNSYPSTPGKTDEFETHQTYVDLHILLSGEERIYLSEVSLLQPYQPYDADKDVAFWKGSEQTSLILRPGTFALFFPQDAHQVGRSSTEDITFIRKIVFKIACELFKNPATEK